MTRQSRSRDAARPTGAAADGTLNVASRACIDASSVAFAASRSSFLFLLQSQPHDVATVYVVAGVAAVAEVSSVLQELRPMCRCFGSIAGGDRCCYDGGRRCCDFVATRLLDGRGTREAKAMLGPLDASDLTIDDPIDFGNVTPRASHNFWR